MQQTNVKECECGQKLTLKGMWWTCTAKKNVECFEDDIHKFQIPMGA